jgi:hypothetical protein
MFCNDVIRLSMRRALKYRTSPKTVVAVSWKLTVTVLPEPDPPLEQEEVRSAAPHDANVLPERASNAVIADA